MKKIIVLIIFGISILMNSCIKDNDVINIDSTNEQQNSLKEGSTNLEYLYTDVSYDPISGEVYVVVLGCWWPSYNCLPEVVITPSTKGSSEKLLNAYNDFINKFNNDEVSIFFSNGDYLTLFPALKDMEDIVEGLRTKEIVLHYDIGKENGFDHYIGLPKGVDYHSDWRDKVKCVFQIDNRLD